VTSENASEGLRQAGYRDLLLTLVSYPDRAPDEALRNAARLAARLGGDVTAMAPVLRVAAPRNRLADLLMDFEELVRTEETRSAANARSLVDAFEAAARPLGVPVHPHIQTVDLYSVAERFADEARVHDLALVPYGRATTNDRSIVEALLFQSGRPVLLFPDTSPLADHGRVGAVVVAWDGGRAAARALADSMPLLATAERVRVLVVTGEKASVTPGAGVEVVRHLARHGVTAEADEVEAGDRPVGEVMTAYVADQDAGLLVMGAFGRSRARELVLGGATRRILHAADLPVLMSH
jgi:nucleotide-binding universal stress UspA family protein